jgi:hypothetical protein
LPRPAVNNLPGTPWPAYICCTMTRFIRQFSILYLLCIIVLRMLAMPLSLLDYSVHREFIVAHLCENRSKPEIQCGGTCFLHKQLGKAGESSESRDQKGNIKIVVMDFFETHENLAFDYVNSGLEFGLQETSGETANPFFGNIFHPPIA